MPYRKRQHICDRINGTLPDDALAAIFARLPDTADVVRCAATCTRWRRAVATRAATLSHSLPPPGRFLPQLAVGLFHLEKHGPTARTRTAPGAPQPRFLAMASGRRLLGCQRTSMGSLFRGVDGAAVFDFSLPVASRNGRLVLELHPERRADGGVTLCVCNPMTGDLVVLPVLEGVDKPADYGCALLAGDDLRPQRCTTNFFLLLLVYNNHRHGFTALRCFSSDTGRWGAEARSPFPASATELRHIGPAAVLHGAAFWPLDHGALGVRPAADDPTDLQAAVVHLLPYGAAHYWPEKRLLGVSPDNRLFFIYFGILSGPFTLMAKITYFDIRGGDIRTGRKLSYYDVHGADGNRIDGQEGSSFEEMIRIVPQMKMTSRDMTLKLRWVGEKSGMVLFTMGESSGHSGTFALSLREGTVEKLAHGEGHEWGSFIGFEMDWATYLATIAANGRN
ncbi:hypothetical protein EJB05_32639, partial [Eragrostis curvula]